ncbi:SRPBCC family protein [Streptomyces reniochalinae]|uniref:Carbon monoxide dehydrogenase n=1 Tax=Streptomyces reniochalinae TaxID=2250578 RepID=A0A367EDL3_9ACTN|nr:SRPBCC family protein [Streptomyces reniochalinae]RCG16043.1 hypothetical protein DQ392_23765 [Streptomyces reniochalinae]
MQLDHSFSVPVPRAEAWCLFQDIGGIAPCMPGAVLDELDGDSLTGRIKVKVGAVQMSYRGQGTVERDEAAQRVVLDLSGSETRGAGTAAATVVASLTEENGHTRVRVLTDLDLTGRPAQFGRGILVEVGERLIQQFASNLETYLRERPAPTTTTPTPPAAAGAAPATPASAPEPEALDLGAALWPSLARRAKIPGLMAATAVLTALAVRAVLRKPHPDVPPHAP